MPSGIALASAEALGFHLKYLHIIPLTHLPLAAYKPDLHDMISRHHTQNIANTRTPCCHSSLPTWPKTKVTTTAASLVRRDNT